MINKMLEENIEGIKERNYCDKCKTTTWHRYFESNVVGDSYTQCQVCKHKRYLKDFIGTRDRKFKQ